MVSAEFNYIIIPLAGLFSPYKTILYRHIVKHVTDWEIKKELYVQEFLTNALFSTIAV